MFPYLRTIMNEFIVSADIYRCLRIYTCILTRALAHVCLHDQFKLPFNSYEEATSIGPKSN